MSYFLFLPGPAYPKVLSWLSLPRHPHFTPERESFAKFLYAFSNTLIPRTAYINKLRAVQLQPLRPIFLQLHNLFPFPELSEHPDAPPDKRWLPPLLCFLSSAVANPFLPRQTRLECSCLPHYHIEAIQHIFLHQREDYKLPGLLQI